MRTSSINLIAAESKQQHAGEKLAEQTKHKILLSSISVRTFAGQKKEIVSCWCYSGYDGSHGHPM